MKLALFFMVLFLGGLYAHAQKQAPAPIIVERIYTSSGNATAPFDSTHAWTTSPIQYHRIQIRLAQPTYLHSIALPCIRGSQPIKGQVILDGQRFDILDFGRKLQLKQRVETLDIQFLFNARPAPLLFFRGDLHTRVAEFHLDSLPHLGTIVFSDSNGSTQPVHFPRSVEGLVLASSVEEPATRYHPTFLFDGRDEFGWGTDHGQAGAGESIALSLDQPLTVTRLQIWNGQQGSDSAFRLHPRVRTLLLSTGTDAPLRLNLPDRSGPVVVDLPLALTSSVFQVHIESVFPGQGSDVLVVSELQLGDAAGWWTVAPDRDAQLNTFVRAKTKGTALGDILDRPLLGSSSPKGGHSSPSRTWWVNFGADGSFHYMDYNRQRGKRKELEEGIGGWEHFLPQDGISQVKVWGYRRTVQERATKDTTIATYFEANLAIDAFQIQSNTLFGAIPIRLLPDDMVPCARYVDIQEDLRYRTADNFMGEVLYHPDSLCMPCLLRDTTARALARVQQALDSLAPGLGLSMRLWDAYRPYYVQKKMWAHTPDTNYVANPYTGGSSHNKGLAVDLTLVDASGNALDMGTKFDDFSKKAHHGYKRLPKEVLANRLLLKTAMEAAGFVALPTEWWHYRLPLDLPIADLKFECLY